MNVREVPISESRHAILDSTGQIVCIVHKYIDSREYLFQASEDARQILKKHFKLNEPSLIPSWLGDLYLHFEYDNCKIACLILALLKPVSVMIKPHGTFILFSDIEKYEMKDLGLLSGQLRDRALLLLPVPTPSKWEREIASEFESAWVIEFVRYFRDLHEMLERKFNWDESIKIVTQELAECPDAEYTWSDALQLWFDYSGGALCVSKSNYLGYFDRKMNEINTIGACNLYWHAVSEVCRERLQAFIKKAIDLYSWAKCNEEIKRGELSWPFPR
jgi:hypothetical protein